MAEGEQARLIAWSNEMRAVHDRLRAALEVVWDAVADDRVEDLMAEDGQARRDLLLFCHGFCTALTGHHTGEDRELFPAIARAHPELAPTLARLVQDHSMIGHLVRSLEAALTSSATVDEVSRHLEGIGAIMENHFRYEERELLSVLETLSLDIDIDRALGPL